MPTSPTVTTSGALRVVITCDGKAVQEILPPSSITVHHALNAIPCARLIFADASRVDGAWEGSDQATFAPGAAVSIRAGHGDQDTTIFSGVVVRHGISITQDNRSQLVIECQDKAYLMTLSRRCAHFVEKTDSAILQELIVANGLSAEVQGTSLTHRELVQFHSSDWDFLLARAEFNGFVVSVVDGTVTVKPPDVSAPAVLKVTSGIDLRSFQADIDARCQPASVKAVAWDPKAQALAVSDEVKPTRLNAQGNLTGADLAKAANTGYASLLTSAVQTREALGQWASGAQLKAGLARIRGSLSFQGSALAKVGTLVEVAGVGTRFSGPVYMSGIRHELSEGNWITEATFGLDPRWHMEHTHVSTLPNGGLLPAVRGLQIGVVMRLDADPEGEHRIQVKVPLLQASTEGIWARLLQFHASHTFGAFFVPEVGDEVILGYLHDDPCHPVVLGSLYSSKHAPPRMLEAENTIKTLVTRCKHKLTFDEKDRIISLTTPGNNQVVLDDKRKTVTLKDLNGNTVKLSDAGITLDSPKDITLTAKGGITLDAVQAVAIRSKADVSTQGLNVTSEAQIAITAKGAASAELSASGQTTVKGAMVMIN